MAVVKVNNKETGRRFEIVIDDTMSVQSFMTKLRADNVIDTGPYYLRVTNGEPCPPTKTFRELKDREFDLLRGLPPRPPAFRQLGIFLIDGSASMTEGVVLDGQQPVEAVKNAIAATISKFKNSAKKNCFSFAVVAFGDTAITLLPPKDVEDITNDPFVATDFFNDKKGSRTTNISAGLAVSTQLAQQFLEAKENGKIRKVMVVILTDGMCHHEAATRALATKMRQLPGVAISSCHLETGVVYTEAVNLLTEISDHYATVYDENTIRDFFIHSVSAVFKSG